MDKICENCGNYNGGHCLKKDGKFPYYGSNVERDFSCYAWCGKSVSDIERLNEAITILREECQKHHYCSDGKCPFYNFSGVFHYCELSDNPVRWENIESE